MMDAICIPSDQTCVQILSDVLDDPTHDLDTQIKDAPVSQFMVTADDIFIALQTPETESIRLSCPVYPDDTLARRYAHALAALCQ